MLYCPSIMPIVRELESTRMAKHMWVHWKWQPGLSTRSSDQLSGRGIREGSTTLRDKHVRSSAVVALEAS